MSWIGFNWTEKDKKLLAQWRENVGKNVQVIDEMSPQYIPYTDKDEWLPIPYVIETTDRKTHVKIEKEIKQAPTIIVPVEKKKRIPKPSRYPISQRTPIPKWKKESLVNARGMICEDCRNTDFDQFHHVDGDPTNHESDNLRLLCYRCHKKADKVLHWSGKGNRRGRRVVQY